jgi:hypothetical protein
VNIAGKKLIPIIIVLAAIIFLLNTNILGGGQKKMEIKYNSDGTMILEPQIYRTGVSNSLSLFPVPQANSVGTNDYKNAITIISFPKGKMEMDNYFRGAVDDVQGGGTYLPVVSPEMIGFGQMRRFLLYNFKTKKHEEYRIVFSIDETIEKIAIADPDKRRFIFEVRAYNSKTQSAWDFTKSLQLVDLSEKKVNLIKEIAKSKGSTWAVAYDKVFLWNFSEKIIQVFDMNLEPSQHTLADLINVNKNKIDFIQLYLHPKLPFAILGGGRERETYLSWEEGRPKIPMPLPIKGKQYSFSPDGKWITFRRNMGRYKERTYLAPVSEKYPNYLGTPILLLENYFIEPKYSWTSNPTSFVGDGEEGLYRWELSNEAYPESDKPTFHDYIVEKDLESLAREKK